MHIEDITAFQANPPDRPEQHVLGLDDYVVERRAEDITGVVIHQTGAWAELDLLKAGGDRREARFRAAAELPYHVVAMADGTVCQTKQLRWHVLHGPSLNESTLGLGIEGVYGGEGDELNKPRRITDKAVRAARAGLAHLVAKGRKSGMPIQYVYAHRQTALGAFAEDPGMEVWTKVVTEYGIPQLGLRVRPIIVHRAATPVTRPLPLCASPLDLELGR